ncbi:MAG: hypothetical protein WCC63_08300 [Candidatus Bathyarchaeia archaeon]
MEKAKELLRKEGFTNDEIHQEFWFKNYRVDAVGWSPRRRVAVDCGYCTTKKRKDLERFFDEVICLPYETQTKPIPTEPPTRDVLAKTRLVLIKDDRVMFDVPLSREEWPRESLEDEAGVMEQNFQRFSGLFNAFSHQNRLRMMKLMIEDEDLTVGFADFIRDLDLNPKLVWENTRKLSEGGLLEKSENGRYRCSEFGEASFIMFSAVLRRLQEMFENEGR